MHTSIVLQKFFFFFFPTVHAKRLRALHAAVDAVLVGAPVSVTGMGRHLQSRTRIKHKIKRIDRLVSNTRLYDERKLFYRSMCQWLLNGVPEPVILIDWSDFSKDGRQQLLRAAIPVGGRSIALYEELHPQKHLGNRHIQHRFVAALKELLPSGCRPIAVAASVSTILSTAWISRK